MKLHYSIRLGAAILVAAAVPAIAAHATQPDPEHRVRICHRTASDSNPWVSITVDYAAVDGEGHNDHSHHVADEQHDRGDIIPSIPDVTAGLNWGGGGQSIWNNDCEIPDEQPTPEPTETPTDEPTVPVVTTPPTTPPGDTPNIVVPPVEVSNDNLTRQADAFNPEGVGAAQAEVAAPADQLPFTGAREDLMAATAAALMGAGLFFVRRTRA